MTCRSLLLVLYLAAGALTLPAQSKPDIVGIYIGMSEQAARQQLQTLSDTSRVQEQNIQGVRVLSITRPGDLSSDNFRVLLTNPPGPGMVWMVASLQK